MSALAQRALRPPARAWRGAAIVATVCAGGSRMGMTRARLVVRGEVQGVAFRASAREVAQELGVAGWVRNGPDGEVETEVEGPEREVDVFIAWCRRGPPAAVVEDVEIERSEFRGEFKGFGVLLD